MKFLMNQERQMVWDNIFFSLAWKKNLLSNWKKPSFLVWRACLFSALHCGAGEGSCLLAVPPLLCGSDCPNQKTQETHRAARAPHQRISQQYSYFSTDSLRCWDLGVRGGRAEQRGLKSMLNTLHRIAIIWGWSLESTDFLYKQKNKPDTSWKHL